MLTFLRTLLLLLMSQSGWASGSVIRIHDPWIRGTPAKTLAAYMIIENISSKEQILTAVTSLAFEKVEMHRTIQHNGMMHMQPQAQLAIPPNGQTVLEPGGYHLMLINRKSSVTAQVELTLKFASGEELTVTTPVRETSPSATPSPHHH